LQPVANRLLTKMARPPNGNGLPFKQLFYIAELA